MPADSGLPSYAVRPGVIFPDWTAATAPLAREAVLAIFEAIDADRAWGNYTPAEDAVRTTLLRHYAEQGRAPTVGALARHAGVSESATRSLLASLQARDLVILDADGGAIIGAYPRTERTNEHRVILGERTLNALCAIDALGAAEMYRSDVEIHSRCRACGAPVTVATRDRGRAVADIQPSTAIVWSGSRHTDGRAAESICPIIAFFCDGAHLEAWLGDHHPETPGLRLSIDEALQVGRAIFGPSLAGLEPT